MKIILTIISLLSFILGLMGVIIWKIRKEPMKKALVVFVVSVVIYVVAAFMPEQRAERNESVKRSGNMGYIANDMPVETLTDFSEERAFVQFTDYSEEDLKMAEDGVKAVLADDENDATRYAMKYINYEPQGGNRVALIDTQGRIIWKSERTRNEQALTAASEFRDGLAYFIFNGNEGASYNIIDSEGNVSYTKEYSENFMILSHGGGLFLTAEHTVNFDIDEWKLGTIDKNGNIVAEYQSYEISATPEKPLSVEEPADPSSSLQEVDDALSQLVKERQAWVEESWEYEGASCIIQI